MLLNKKSAVDVDAKADADAKGLAVYVHWPFCKMKCPYCDFNSHVRDSVDHEAWRAAYVREMEYYRDMTGPRTVSSVFFGGGTPSLMETQTAALVIDTIDRLWGLPQGTEITLEANPTSVENGKLNEFRTAGVNRVSLGVQALNDADLKKLGRQHSADEALAAVNIAASVFDRFSFDLIYARPQQTPEMWQAELQQALSYAAGHMSLYQLTIEEGTQYHTLHARGELVIPDSDAAAELYEITQSMMEAAGLPAYEISNHARAGDESQHNLVYWRYGDYAGIGPGAHGRLTVDGKKLATRAHRAPEMWLERVTAHGHGAHGFDEVDFTKRGREMLMMGLRLAEGVDLKRFAAETGQDFSDFVNAKQVTMLKDEGLIDITPRYLTATASGRQRLDAVLSYLLA
jgi:oxygen-independent coproporphyrinogen-3 oxidase